MVLGPSYTDNKTQTYNPVVNIKPLYLEIHSAGIHVCILFTVCVCVHIHTYICMYACTEFIGLAGSSSLVMSNVYWQHHCLSSDHTGNC